MITTKTPKRDQHIVQIAKPLVMDRKIVIIFFECYHLVKQADRQLKVPDGKIKCIDCGQNHTSAFINCNVRIEYINSRKKQQQHQQQQRNNKTYKTQYKGFSEAPELRNFNFPGIDPRQRATTQAWNNKNTIPQSNDKNDLFTPEECHSILMDLVTKLKECKNKIEQFSAISLIAQKYMCP